MSDRPSTALPPPPIRGMPRSDDAERSLLSCFLEWPNELLADAAAKLSPDHFYHVGNRLIYEEMQAFQADPSCKPLDPVTFSQWLLDRQLMDKIGGPSTLAELTDVRLTPANYPYYAGILRDKLTARQIIGACSECIQTVYDCEETPLDALAQVSEKIMNLENRGADKFRKMPELVMAALDRYQKAAMLDGRLPGIPTGFPTLDHHTGGMLPGEVWVIAGGISDAKSAFSENLAHSSVMAHKPTAIYTFEMSDDKLTDRFFSIDGKVANTSIKHGLMTHEESRSMASASSRLMKYPLYLRDVSGMKLSALLGDMRTMKRRYNVEVFVVDYTQLIEPDKKGHTRESEVAEMSRKLKAASKNLSATVIALSQLNDQGKLRESRAIGADGDIVLTLSVPEKPEEDWERPSVPEKDETKRDLRISKNRDGTRGLTLKYRFHGPTFTFTEEAPTAPPHEATPRHHSDR